MAHEDYKGSFYANSSNREAANKHLKGSKKYKEMIDQDSKVSDKYKNLPFKFIKPPKRFQARREIYFICSCQEISLVNKHTIGTTCRRCQKYNRVEENPHFASEEELDLYLQKRSANK